MKPGDGVVVEATPYPSGVVGLHYERERATAS